MISCPRKKQFNCVLWEAVAITVLVFVAVWTIVDKTFDLTPSREILVAIGSTFAICWCIWVVRTFRAIMSWWIHMHDSVDHALILLNETKQDLKDIKSDTKPK